MKVLSICDLLAHTQKAYVDNGFPKEADAIQRVLERVRCMSSGDSGDEPMTSEQLNLIRSEWSASSASYDEKRAFIVVRYRTEHLEAVPSSAFGELVQWLQTGQYEGLTW